MRTIFRPRNEDSIPLSLEEFDASPVESQVWLAATTFCRQEHRPYSDRTHPERIEVELRGLRVNDHILIVRSEVEIQKEYRNTEYLGVSLSGELKLLALLQIKDVSRSLLKSRFLPLKRRPNWNVGKFNLDNRAARLCEILDLTLEVPRGSNIAASDLFSSFHTPEKAWTKENLEWTGQKFILHPTFGVQVGVTRTAKVYDEGLFNFLAVFPFSVERSAEMDGFEASAQRVAWARYEYEQQELEKSIVAQEKEVEESRARQTTASERLRFARAHLEQLKLEMPEEENGGQT
jgi:hypothetical protein